MELLDLLEKRVTALVEELEQVRRQNDALREQLSQSCVACTQQQEENTSLKEALVQEQQLKDTVLERIEFLLQRLNDLDTPA